MICFRNPRLQNWLRMVLKEGADGGVRPRAGNELGGDERADNFFYELLVGDMVRSDNGEIVVNSDEEGNDDNGGGMSADMLWSYGHGRIARIDESSFENRGEQAQGAEDSAQGNGGRRRWEAQAQSVWSDEEGAKAAATALLFPDRTEDFPTTWNVGRFRRRVFGGPRGARGWKPVVEIGYGGKPHTVLDQVVRKNQVLKWRFRVQTEDNLRLLRLSVRVNKSKEDDEEEEIFTEIFALDQLNTAMGLLEGSWFAGDQDRTVQLVFENPDESGHRYWDPRASVAYAWLVEEADVVPPVGGAGPAAAPPVGGTTAAGSRSAVEGEGAVFSGPLHQGGEGDGHEDDRTPSPSRRRSLLRSSSSQTSPHRHAGHVVVAGATALTSAQRRGRYPSGVYITADLDTINGGLNNFACDLPSRVDTRVLRYDVEEKKFALEVSTSVGFPFPSSPIDGGVVRARSSAVPNVVVVHQPWAEFVSLNARLAGTGMKIGAPFPENRMLRKAARAGLAKDDADVLVAALSSWLQQVTAQDPFCRNPWLTHFTQGHTVRSLPTTVLDIFRPDGGYTKNYILPALSWFVIEDWVCHALQTQGLWMVNFSRESRDWDAALDDKFSRQALWFFAYTSVGGLVTLGASHFVSRTAQVFQRTRRQQTRDLAEAANGSSSDGQRDDPSTAAREDSPVLLRRSIPPAAGGMLRRRSASSRTGLVVEENDRTQQDRPSTNSRPRGLRSSLTRQSTLQLKLQHYHDEVRTLLGHTRALRAALSTALTEGGWQAWADLRRDAAEIPSSMARVLRSSFGITVSILTRILRFASETVPAAFARASVLLWELFHQIPHKLAKIFAALARFNLHLVRRKLANLWQHIRDKLAAVKNQFDQVWTWYADLVEKTRLRVRDRHTMANSAERKLWWLINLGDVKAEKKKLSDPEGWNQEAEQRKRKAKEWKDISDRYVVYLCLLWTEDYIFDAAAIAWLASWASVGSILDWADGVENLSASAFRGLGKFAALKALRLLVAFPPKVVCEKVTKNLTDFLPENFPSGWISPRAEPLADKTRPREDVRRAAPVVLVGGPVTMIAGAGVGALLAPVPAVPYVLLMLLVLSGCRHVCCVVASAELSINGWDEGAGHDLGLAEVPHFEQQCPDEIGESAAALNNAIGQQLVTEVERTVRS